MPLTQPPLDENGNIEPHDHDGIADGDTIIRKISHHFVVDDKNGGKRLSSMAFKASNNEMSVDIESLMLEDGINPQEFVTTPVWIGSISLMAGAFRSAGLMVGYEPVEGNPYHGEVWGKVTSSKSKTLAKAANWYVPISGVSVI